MRAATRRGRLWERPFRLRGSTDADTDALREAVGKTLEGVRVRDLQRLAPDILAGLLPRLYPQMLQVAYDHQDAGRPIYIVTAASQEMCELVATCCASTAGSARAPRPRRRLHGPRSSPSPTARARRWRSASWPRARASTSPPPGATPTASPTCPCCAPSGTPWWSTPMLSCSRVAREEGWEILTFETLGRSIAGGGAAAVGAGGAAGRRGGLAPARRLPRLDELLQLTDEQREIRALARRFADEEIAPQRASGIASTIPQGGPRASSASSA